MRGGGWPARFLRTRPYRREGGRPGAGCGRLPAYDRGVPGLPRVSPAVLRRLALATLVANVGIVVTGGAVRLTGSGLGCPTWPRCTDTSYVPTPELAGHGLIEFGNRTLTSVLVAITLATLAAALLCRPRRRPVVRLAVGVFVGSAAGRAPTRRPSRWCRVRSACSPASWSGWPRRPWCWAPWSPAAARTPGTPRRRAPAWTRAWWPS